MSVDGADSARSASPDSPRVWHIAKPFGSGPKRNQIHFVPASGDDVVQETARDTSPGRGSSVADFYLSVVLPSDSGSQNASNPGRLTHTPSIQGAGPASKQLECGLRSHSRSTAGSSTGKSRSMIESPHNFTPNTASSLSAGERETSKSPSNLDTSAASGENDSAASLSAVAAVQPDLAVVQPSIETSAAMSEICSTCRARVTDWKAHVRTTAHMASEEHSKPPHHLNRQSEGYKHMVRMGWDPDGSKGLGVEGQGIRFPVRSSTKKDNLGIGARASKSIRDPAEDVSDPNAKRQRLLTAKEVQRLEKAERAARQDLHDYLRH
ncbi:hypothetical protein Dda_6190 [Drechslerella dactyloides]|uniref:G-patch domain-containing protein n=1 Tax=Drechslerella dactyloides TaxID=74499 RepID=A0AAD6IZB0_DREDA|nr:hypothetical protein Dda_6190 [Drechslerella dactyloides]